MVNNLTSVGPSGGITDWLSSLTFTAPGYVIDGDTVLTNGITVTHGTGTTRFRNGLRMIRHSQTIEVTHPFAILKLDDFLALPSNGTPDETWVGENPPPPPDIVTFDTEGIVEVAKLTGKGLILEKYGTGKLALISTEGKYQRAYIREGMLTLLGSALGDHFFEGLGCKYFFSSSKRVTL
jgi:hypothetical protein